MACVFHNYLGKVKCKIYRWFQSGLSRKILNVRLSYCAIYKASQPINLGVEYSQNYVNYHFIRSCSCIKLWTSQIQITELMQRNLLHIFLIRLHSCPTSRFCIQIQPTSDLVVLLEQTADPPWIPLLTLGRTFLKLFLAPNYIKNTYNETIYNHLITRIKLYKTITFVNWTKQKQSLLPRISKKHLLL